MLEEGRRRLLDNPARFEGVAVRGVDEHVWRHTRRGDRYVTVIIDLTPIRDGTGPARLLDMVEVVAMDGFSGFKTATTEALPQAVAVMDPFHVVRLAGNALDSCRRRVQQQRLDGLFADERHVAVEVTWSIYQRMVTAYREPDRAVAVLGGEALSDIAALRAEPGVYGPVASDPVGGRYLLDRLGSRDDFLAQLVLEFLAKPSA